MSSNVIVKEVSNLFIPIIIFFGLYVQFHGDFGPGGGFQAGVIVAVGIILFTLVYGLDKTTEYLPLKIVRSLMAMGLCLFIWTGIASILFGGEFLNYSVLGSNPLSGQHIGIFLIELGVGITVASVMVMIFYAFEGRGH